MNKKLLYILTFLLRGWEVSILLLLPVFQTQGKINVFQVGLLGATMSFFTIISNLNAGKLSEKLGNKNILILGILFYSISWLAILAPANIASLIFIYSLAGIGSGIYNPIVNSLIAQISEKNRAREMGDFSAFADLGRVAFSSITLILVGIVTPTTFSLLYVLIGFIFLILLIKNAKTKKADIGKTEEVILEEVKILNLLKEKKYLLSVITGMFDGFASASLYIFIPLLLIPKGITIFNTGFLSSIFFLGYFSGRLLLGRLADKYGASLILITSEILMASIIVGLIFTNNIFLVGSLLFALGIFTRGTSPVIRAMVAEAVKEKRNFNKAYSLYSFSVNSSSVASRSAFGSMAGSLGISSVFYLAGIVALLTVFPISLYARIGKKNS